jgi:hypothetical protein
MNDQTEVETVSGGNEQVSRRGAVSLQNRDTGVHDSRLVSDDDGVGTGAAGRADISGTGEQFILASWANLAGGLWAIIAPFVLTYSATVPRARANDLVLGTLIASMAATRIFGNYRSARLNATISALTVLPGIWLIIAPFVLGYLDMTSPMRSDIITGIATIVFAAWAYMTSRYDNRQVA